MSWMHRVLLASLVAWLPLSHAAAEDGDDPPGITALKEFREGRKPKNPVQNRFLTKAKRFELTLMGGTAPSNPFANRYAVSLNFGYHFNEVLAVTGLFTYLPDLYKQDIAALVPILIQRAEGQRDFQQPLDKITLSAAFGVRWSPVYGKINILGEVVANFDFFLFLGAGLVVQNEYYAVQNPTPSDDSVSEYFNLIGPETEVRFAPMIGFGGNFFITQLVALRLDGRLGIVPDDLPVYDPDADNSGMRAITLFTAQAGFTFFIPKMKRRLYDF